MMVIDDFVKDDNDENYDDYNVSVAFDDSLLSLTVVSHCLILFFRLGFILGSFYVISTV